MNRSQKDNSGAISEDYIGQSTLTADLIQGDLVLLED